MEKLKLRNIEINNSRIEYFRKGDGDKLILLHGWNCSLYNFYFNIPFLIKYFDLIIPNLPGNGNSQEWNKEYSPYNFACFLKDFVNSLKIKKFYLLGHSMGARIALFFALNYPNYLKKQILLEPILIQNKKQSKMKIKVLEYLKTNRNKTSLKY